MKISVVVPVYNVKDDLARCMSSLMAQSFLDREIILVDDGSTDGSGEMCGRYAALPGVRVIHQENAGLGMARNRGLLAAQGDYVLFIDSDDYTGPALLERLYAAASEYEADISIGGFTMVAPGGRESPRPCEKQTRLFQGDEIRELVLNTVGSLPREALDSKYGVSACARLYRRSLVMEHAVRFVSERELISEDLIFNLAFLKYAQRAAVTADASYYYCNNAASLSKRHRADRFERDLALCREVRRLLSESFEEKEYCLYLQRLLISRARFDIVQDTGYHDRENPSYPLREAVKGIAGSAALQEALRDYPWKELPGMQGVFAFAMKNQWTGLLILLSRARRILP